MTQEKVEGALQGKQGKQGKGKHRGQGPKQPQLSRAAQRDKDRADKLTKKLARAEKPDTAVVDKRALETNATVALLGKNDYLVDQLRKKVGFDRSINIADAMNVLQINQSIRDLLSVQNALVCHVLGVDYEPPRGMDVPKVDASTVNTAELLETLTTIVSSVQKVVEAEPKAA